MDKMLEVLKKVYRMHQLHDPRIDWDNLQSEVYSILYDELKNEGFNEWVKNVKENMLEKKWD